MKVGEIMTKDVAFATPSMTLRQAAQVMKELNVGALPVRDKPNGLLGIVTDRDITCRAVAGGLNPATATVKEVMSGNIEYCTEDEDVKDAVQQMEKRQIRRMPVRGKNNQIVGMLATADISRHAPHELAGELMESVSQARA